MKSLKQALLSLTAFIMCAVIASSGMPALVLAEDADPAVGFADEYLDCDTYDVDKYSNPYWSGDIVYNEAVFPLERADGSMEPVSLMYKAAKILAVRDSTLGIKYIEGEDYVLTSDGRLELVAGGGIETIPYSDVYGPDYAPGLGRYDTLDGGSVSWGESKYYHESQISVTYIPAEEWTGFVQQPKGDLLPNTVAKLQGGAELNIVYLGDSIMWGANSTKLRNWEPYADIWCDMATLRLKNLYPDADITYVNSNQGGQDVGWAAENLDSLLLQYKPDLAVIAFGMNDGMNGDSPEKYLRGIESCVNRIQAELPGCEVLLVSSMFANPDCHDANRFRSFAEGMKQFEKAGVALADVTSLHDSILKNKIYLDTTGNNMCHPNDFGARMYTQTVVEALTASDSAMISEYKSALCGKLRAYADGRVYDLAMETAAAEALESGISDINAATTVTSAYFNYKNAAAIIDAVPEISETRIYSVDFERLIFNSEYKIGLASSMGSVTADYSRDKCSMKITSDGGADPHVCLDYTIAPAEISADTYKYAVITYAQPTSNSESSKFGFLYYATGTVTEKQNGMSVRFPTVRDGAYHSAIADLSGKTNWTGKINMLRIDPFTTAPSGDVMYIDSVILCRTAEEAESAAALRAERAGGAFNGDYVSSDWSSGTSHDGLSAVSAEYKAGDVDGNNRVNIFDLIRVKRALLGYTEKTDVMDVNGDSGIDNFDIICLKRGIIGKIQLPVKSVICSEVGASADGAVITATADTGVFSDGDAVLDASSFGASADTAYEYAVIRASASGCTGKSAGVTVNYADKSSVSGGVYLPSNSAYTAIIPLSGKTGVESIGFSFPDGSAAGDTITLHYAALCTDRESADLAADASESAGSIDTAWVEVRFDNADKASMLSELNSTTAVFDAGERALKMTVSGNGIDPRALLDMSEFGISADEYKYIVYTYKTPETVSGTVSAEMFLCAGNIGVPTAGYSTVFVQGTKGVYNSQIIDLSGTAWWTGDIHSVRLDYFTSASVGSVSYIDSVVFCRDKADAQKYIASRTF